MKQKRFGASAPYNQQLVDWLVVPTPLQELVTGGHRQLKTKNRPRIRCRGERSRSIRTILCSLVQLQLKKNIFDRAGCQKVHETAVVCAVCRSAQNRPKAPFRIDMAATLARLGVNFGQQGLNFGPTWTNWLQLRPNGSKMAQLGSNLG